MKRAILFLFLLAFSMECFGQWNKGPSGDPISTIGLGTATGSYTEEQYSLDRDLDGESYQYATYFLESGRLCGSSSRFWLYTSFSMDTTDFREHRHELKIDLLSRNTAKGLQTQFKFGNNNALILDGSLFLGLGIAQGTKSITHSSGNKYADFPPQYGIDVGYGFIGNTFLMFDKTWVVGMKMIYANNSIYMNYNDYTGELIHRKSGLLYIGWYAEPEPDCTPTQYVPCL